MISIYLLLDFFKSQSKLIISPLYKEVARLAKGDGGRTRVIDYMMAKHGLERNVWMARSAVERLYAGEKRELERMLEELRYKWVT